MIATVWKREETLNANGREHRVFLWMTPLEKELPKQ